MLWPFTMKVSPLVHILLVFYTSSCVSLSEARQQNSVKDEEQKMNAETDSVKNHTGVYECF